jgi:hypothetical protein
VEEHVEAPYKKIFMENKVFALLATPSRAFVLQIEKRNQEAALSKRRSRFGSCFISLLARFRKQHILW